MRTDRETDRQDEAGGGTRNCANWPLNELLFCPMFYPITNRILLFKGFQASSFRSFC